VRPAVLIRILFLCLLSVPVPGKAAEVRAGEAAPSAEKRASSAAKGAAKGKPAEKKRRKVTADPTLLAGEPAFEVAEDGTVTARWRTRTPTLQGSLTYGVFMPDQDLDIPRWIGRAPERDPGGKAAVEHEARFSVGRLEALGRWRPGAPNGTGRVAVRVEIILPRGGSAFVDRVFGVRWVKGKFRRTAAVVEGPFVSLPTTNSFTVAFRTDTKTHARVTVIDPQGDRLLFASEGESDRHEITVSGLFADTVYRYRVQIIPADDPALLVASPPARARTAPPREFGRSFTFAHLCDSRSGAGGGEYSMEGVNARTLETLLILAYRRGAELVVFPGDLVNGYTTSVGRFRRELRSWKRVASPVGAYVPIFPTAGNHEALIDRWDDGLVLDRKDTPMERVFAEEFVNYTNGPRPAPGAPPYKELVYSFDYGDTHFAFVLTNYWYTNRPGSRPGVREGTVDEIQLEWLKQDLARARKRGLRHLFVAGHEPGFPCGGHAGDAMYWGGRIPEVNAMREKFWRILGEAGVVAYLCGDEHNYSRLLVDASLVPGMKHPVWQIVSGGAGAPFHTPDTNVPWHRKVAFFTPQRHLCLITVDGKVVTLEVVNETGGRIESAVLAGE